MPQKTVPAVTRVPRCAVQCEAMVRTVKIETTPTSSIYLLLPIKLSIILHIKLLTRGYAIVGVKVVEVD